MFFEKILPFSETIMRGACHERARIRNKLPIHRIEGGTFDSPCMLINDIF